MVNQRTIPLLKSLITLSLVKHKVLRVDVKLLRKDANWEGVILSSIFEIKAMTILE